MTGKRSRSFPCSVFCAGKQGLIIKTAADYCLKHPNILQPRFDVASVIIDDGKVLSIDYMTNAFDTTGYNIIF